MDGFAALFGADVLLKVILIDTHETFKNASFEFPCVVGVLQAGRAKIALVDFDLEELGGWGIDCKV